MNAIEDLCGFEELESNIDVFIAPISDDVRSKAFEIAQTLRSNGIATDVDLTRRKFKKLMNYANSKKVKNVAIVGAKDLEENKITVKNMESGRFWKF